MPTLLLFMMEGLFSRIIFQQLLESGHTITGVVLPGRSTITTVPQTDNPLEVLDNKSIASLCRFHNVPLYTIQSNHIDEYQMLLTKAQPELVVVACFPFLLPAVLYEYPVLGTYNLHPSLLPRYRGPLPLFWQFYFGDKDAGISLHEVTETFDSGNIIAQKKVSLEDGVSSAQATALLAEAAYKLFFDLVEHIADNRPEGLPQPENQASYYSWPAREQFRLTPDWPIMRAYNFICGTRHWKQGYHYLIQDKDIIIKNAHDFVLDNQQTTEQQPANRRWLTFQGGRLLVEL